MSSLILTGCWSLDATTVPDATKPAVSEASNLYRVAATRLRSGEYTTTDDLRNDLQTAHDILKLPHDADFKTRFPELYGPNKSIDATLRESLAKRLEGG